MYWKKKGIQIVATSKKRKQPLQAAAHATQRLPGEAAIAEGGPVGSPRTISVPTPLVV